MHVIIKDVSEMLTQQNLDCAFAHEIMNVDFGVTHFPKFVDGIAAVDVEQGHERFEYVQMECGGDQFPVSSPFVTYKVFEYLQ